MADQELERPETTGSAQRRAEAFAQKLGMDTEGYSQVTEDAVSHAIAPRPGLPPPSPADVWVPVGPRNVTGRMNALAQDPVNPSILYAGSAYGGLWRTIDGGDTWEHLGEAEHNFPVSAIAIPEQDPNTLYIGTGSTSIFAPSGRGLYRVEVPAPRSEATFVRLAPAPPINVPPANINGIPSLRGAAMRYTRIRMDPFDKDRFWAASQTGLWRWEGRPESGAPRFILEFPPSEIESGDFVPPLSTEVPTPDHPSLNYATDVLVAPDPRDRQAPRYVVIYVGIETGGVYRGRFDRQTHTTRWEKTLSVFSSELVPGRIRLALCERVPTRVYAIMAGFLSGRPTPVNRSDDNGETWRETGIVFDDGQTQAGFHMTLEVSPTDPDVVFAGIVDAYLTQTGGRDWKKILFSKDFDRLGDYAQHADQHAALFDRFERRRLWIAHDGGLAVAPDVQVRPRTRGYFRVRSHGIAAAQFQGIAVNPAPNRAFMSGGGLQDGGAVLSFGGPNWASVNSADGNHFAFDPGNDRRYLTSTQYRQEAAEVFLSTGLVLIINPIIPDLPEVEAPRNAMGVLLRTIGDLSGSGDHEPFLPVIAQNPATPGSVILGWQAFGVKAAAYSSIDAGRTVSPLTGLTAAITPPDTFTTAACFGPAVNPSGKVEGWVGFSNGNLLRTDDAPAGTWVPPAAPLPLGPGVAASAISRIVVHPADDRVVAVCTSGTPGRAFITYDRGASWQELTARRPASITIAGPASIPARQRRQFTATAHFADGGDFDATTSVRWRSSDTNKGGFSTTAAEEGQFISSAAGTITATATLDLFGVPVSGTLEITVTAGAGSEPAPLPPHERGFDLRALPPCPLTSLAFDRNNPTRLFAGTIAGVYVLEGLPAPPPPAAATPVVTINWRPFSQGLPLTLVNDIVTVPGTNMLRAATHGRGVWDCDLAAATRPQHRLFIRQTVIEDGFTYPRPFPPPIGFDPRLMLSSVALDHAHAFDIRVDAAPQQFFDARVDGVELEERLGVDELQPLVSNSVYVQVHNVGREAVRNVQVHLYFRRSPIAAPHGVAPVAITGVDLGQVTELYNPPGFDPTGGGSPADGATWTRVGAAQPLTSVGPAAPAVARFDWQPPAALADHDVALLALCSGPDAAHDPLPAAPAGGPDIAAFIQQERRAALRILHVAALPLPDITIRGGVDDDGRRGATVSALRSSHIIVVQTAPADPAAAFRDLLDTRPTDRLRAGVENHIYVRVHNRGRAVVRAQVELWAVKVKRDLTPDFPLDHWLQLTAAPVEVDVPPNDYALAEVRWTPPDPEPAEAQKSYILVALAKSADSNDPQPNRSTITSEATFWEFLQRKAGSDNVAARAIRWVTS